MTALNAAVARPSGRNTSTMRDCTPPVKKYPLHQFELVIGINLIGTFRCIAHAAAGMVDAEPGEDGEKGVIINTASVAAEDGQIGQAAYSASKGGVLAMALPIARDLAVVYAITFGGFVAFGVYLPTFLKTVYGLETTDAASRAAGFVVLATLARPAGGWPPPRSGWAPGRRSTPTSTSCRSPPAT